jgi:hypothetical protein
MVIDVDNMSDAVDADIGDAVNCCAVMDVASMSGAVATDIGVADKCYTLGNNV